jgi:hypothetical protein
MKITGTKTELTNETKIVNRFDNRTLDKSLNLAIAKANELLSVDGKMLGNLLDKNDWKYDSGTGQEVFIKILGCTKLAPIFFYKPKNPFTRAMGYSDGKAIHLNSKKFKGFSFNDLVGLLCHEYLHMAGFSHGNNYKTEEKCLYSVPYFVSENISKWM